MKYNASLLRFLLAGSIPLLANCGSAPKKPADPSISAAAGKQKSDGKTTVSDGKTAKGRVDDLDEYSAAPVDDPWQPLNRVTFAVNDFIYTIALRPISKVYKTVVPKVVRTGVYNAYENVKFPVRLVNNALQGNFKRVGQETGKFVVNTVAGFGGLGRPSDHIPALADVPDADTGQTFAKWGIQPGPYFVIPILGPSTVRETVGLAGDYGLNPVTWVTIFYGGPAWTVAIPTVNTMRALPVQMDIYDAAGSDALDRYLAVRGYYLQYRAEVALR
jgi:phospholipid-binding lipoprotein MlaA